MIQFLQFVSMLGTELYELFVYVTGGQPDPEQEKQLAARIIRKASDAQMRKELGIQ